MDTKLRCRHFTHFYRTSETWCPTRYLLWMVLLWSTVTLWGILTRIFPSMWILNKHVGVFSCIYTIFLNLETSCHRVMLKNLDSDFSLYSHALYEKPLNHRFIQSLFSTLIHTPGTRETCGSKSFPRHANWKREQLGIEPPTFRLINALH